MLIETYSHPFFKAKATNATDTSFPSRIPTNTEPVDDGVVTFGWPGAMTSNSCLVIPYGTGDDNDVFAMRVIGWRVIGNNPRTRLWVPYLLAELTCTMGTAVGVAGMEVVATERFCDTLAIVTGNSNVTTEIVSPTGNIIAHAMIDVKGSHKVEFTFDMTTGDPTGANCLVAKL